MNRLTLLAITSLLLGLTLPVQAEPDMPTLIFGTNTNGIRDVSKQDLELNFDLAFSSFSNKYGITTKLKVFDNHQALITAFDQGKLDGIFGLATDILAREDQLNSKMTAVVFANGQYKFRYYLLVRKADNISSIEQLKGKRISIPQFQEVESMYLDTLLLKHKLAESSLFFSQILNTSNSNTTITDLFFNRVDSAVVNENEYQTALELNPQIGQKISILEQSAPFVLMVGAVKKGLSADIESRAYTATLDYPKSEAGINLFKLLGMKEIRFIHSDDLDTLRVLKNEYAQLKDNSKLGLKQKPNLPAKQLSSKKNPLQISNTSRDKLP